MKSKEVNSVDVPTYSILVSPSGEIIDVQVHQQGASGIASRLKGRSYAHECASQYRQAVMGLLNGDRQILSVVMSPPTLGIDAWFAVVGVPLSTSKEIGALFVHMDISSWVSNSLARSASPNRINMDLVQQAMVSTFVGNQSAGRKGRNFEGVYDGIESLTARQREVLKLIGLGKTNLEIAEDLSCSLNTIKRHVTAVLQKLKLPNRTRAAALVNQLGHQLDD